MNIKEIQFSGLEIGEATSLDPIRVFFEDDEAGGGRVIITCWDLAWCYRWSAPGMPIAKFFQKASTDYLVNALKAKDYVSSQRRMNDQEQYLARIIRAIKDALGSPGEGK